MPTYRFTDGPLAGSYRQPPGRLSTCGGWLAWRVDLYERVGLQDGVVYFRLALGHNHYER